MQELGHNALKINPLIPTDLVIDHSVQADYARVKDAAKKNEELEFSRNRERFQFLKWGQKNLKNFTIIPPGSGIVHQVNLEYLARVVFNNDGLLYPDTLVGADSHTTMINGLGIVGWGVGGIEAESAMLGQTLAMVLPQVVGVRFTGKLNPTVNATDLVLTVVETLRKRGVVGKFVERLFKPRLEYCVGSLLSKRQAAFQKNRSTLDPLMCVAGEMLKCVNARRREAWKVFFFMGISKAYDSVWIKGLLWKLLKKLKGVPKSYVLWIKAWLERRFVYVASGASKSRVREALVGLPQGGVLSCLLWLVYIDQI